jgi:serine phosphatase RsbU (regulator of sigma subunit)
MNQAAILDDILLVDDTPANLRLLAQILNGHGYHVRAVTSGMRALESAQHSPPNLFLLDIRMPEMSGFEVCERLKANEQTREIPVIFLSALDDIQDKVRAFELGGVDYITKPFQIEEVLARVETHLALRRLQSQLQEANRRYERELSLAGQIQASFIPRSPPNMPGWECACRLLPAQETSGDFYDLIRLPDGRLAILIADVLDKGAGAALFMALNLSLLRAALEGHPGNPSHVFETVNHHILADTQTDQFVTVFLGVLDGAQGKLVYANAGHWPPVLARGAAHDDLQELRRTGLPLGIEDPTSWDEKEILLQPGDVLALYTDGVNEARSPGGEYYGIPRVKMTLRETMHMPAEEILGKILSGVQQFTGKERGEDDIALLVLKRVAF